MNLSFRGHLLPLLLLIAMLSACSENVQNSDGTSTELSLGESVTTQILLDDVQLLKDSGVATDSAYGIFSIGWNQFIPPDQDSAALSGHAFAFSADTLLPFLSPRFHRRGGLDMGDVSLDYGSGSIDLLKRETRDGGYTYSLFQHCRDTVDLELPFIGGATYTFGATGSDEFSPLSVSLNAPDALMGFTSHADEDSVSIAEDLVLTWSGGSPTADVVLRVMGFDEGHGRHGRRGGRHGRGFGHHPGERPLPYQRAGSIFVVLSGNPGTYTVPTDSLQALVSDGNPGSVMIHISQNIENGFTHDGKTFNAVIRNGDRVRLNLAD
ncbi:MAG TPA: hypothetical protein PKV71_10770 [Calditrichia bacterium]|nr:hypothetical protein [Calditrichota bacterium]HQU71710.1 hypothetical protein [Calditrichia bacterium]HQV32352.1 hypothetical protein [Calditrichia bacterium]